MKYWDSVKHLFWHNSDVPLLFHSGIFFFIFSIFLIGYALVAGTKNLRNIFIILFSFYFYFLAGGLFILLLVLTITLDYFFSWLIIKLKNNFARTLVLLLGILFSVSFLLYFKYRNFYFLNSNAYFGTHYPIIELVMPIGISFYTFQSISYLADTYKRKIAFPVYTDYLMYMSFFPHLFAGPIVRASDFLPQASKKISISKENISEAFFLISKGLIKKAIVADFIAQYSDVVFSQPDGFSGTENIFATLCYAFQIFFDFSGYTDMAIGIALLLGFRLGVNFLSPYKSTSITEFWRRWHISLSSWLRDYIYIPLGGNKKGYQLQLFFLLLTMVIGGFWHGPNWKYVFWGTAHGTLLMLHKLYVRFIRFSPDAYMGTFMKPVYWLLTFSCVALLWVPFRAKSMSAAIVMYKSIFTGIDYHRFLLVIENNPLVVIIFGTGLVLALLPTFIKEFIRKNYYRLHFTLKIVVLAIIIQLILQVRTADVHPFIYFDF